MCLLCPAGVKSCLGFFVMIFSSAYIHEGMDYPNDPDPNKVNARNVIANLYM